jgi:hypothetical protein
MMLSEPDVSLPANLHRLAVLVKDWQGEFLDKARTVCAVNPTAGGVPVYWCFNAAAERDYLAEEFGAGRTLVGMRSLNQIVRVVPERSHVLDPLAQHYAETLLARFGTRPCIVGGNCQSAGIALRVANHLMAAGVPVQRLVVLDAEPRLPFGGSIRLLFGGQSRTHNPFLKPQPDPSRPIPWHWERAWHRFEVRTVSGGHGEYFRPENVPSLARAILEPWSQASVSSSPGDGHLARVRRAVCRVTDVAREATTVEVVMPETVAPGDGLGLMPLWCSPAGSLVPQPGPDWIVPVNSRAVWRRTFENPFSAQGGVLIPVLCLAGHGPLIWPKVASWNLARRPDQTD